MIPTLALLAVHLPFALTMSRIDVLEHRLPNLGTLALTGLLLATSGIVWAAGLVDAHAWTNAAFVASVLTIGAVLLALISPAALGMGDAKLVFATVFPCALLGGGLIVYAFAWILGVGALAGLVTLIATKSLASRFAFGPVLLSAPYGALLIQSVAALL